MALNALLLIVVPEPPNSFRFPTFTFVRFIVCICSSCSRELLDPSWALMEMLLGGLCSSGVQNSISCS